MLTSGDQYMCRKIVQFTVFSFGALETFVNSVDLEKFFKNRILAKIGFDTGEKEPSKLESKMYYFIGPGIPSSWDTNPEIYQSPGFQASQPLRTAWLLCMKQKSRPSG